MALTQKTRKLIQIKMNATPGTTYQLGVPEGTEFDNFTRENTYLPTTVGMSTRYYPCVNWDASITRNGATITTGGQVTNSSSTYATQSQASYAAANISVSKPKLESGKTYYMSADGLYRYGTTSTYNSYYYHLAVTVKSLAVSSKQVGNVAIYNGSTLLAGSISKSAVSSAAYVSYEFDTEDTSLSSLPKIKIKATACAGSSTSSRTKWHQGYYLAGVTKGTSAMANSNFTFAADTITSTNDITLSDDSTTITVSYGAKKTLTIASQSGVSSYSAAYTPSYEKGSYSNVATSASGSTGSTTLYFESGSDITLNATASNGYVFSSSGSGFVSQTSGVPSVVGNGSKSITNAKVASLTKDASFKVVPTTYSITVGIPDSSKAGWGTCYIDSAGTTSKTLVAGVTYTFGFVSSRANQEAPSVDYWSVNGSPIDGNTYTAPTTMSGNVSVSCFLKQNARTVTISKSANGGVSAKRFVKSTGAEISDIGWLKDDGSDYIKVTPVPDAHYDAIVTTSGLDEYDEGGSGSYSLTSGALAATVDVAFSLAECVIKTAMPDGFDGICEVRPETATMRWDAESTTFVNVYCELKAAYIDMYRVASWNIGGVTRTDVEVQTAGTSWYFTVSPSDVNGKAELVCTPNLVPTTNNFELSVTGSAHLLQLSVEVGTETREYLDVGETSWSKDIRESKSISIGLTKVFGGKISSVTASGVTITSQSESEIQLTMPSNDCSIAIAVNEIEKIFTFVQLSTETAHAEVIVGSVTVAGNGAEMGKVEGTHDAQTFSFYRELPYTLTASDNDATYAFAGWYKSGVLHSTLLSITVSATTSETYVAKYVMKKIGTIAIQYGLKSGNDTTSTELPAGAKFGIEITTPKDSSEGWVVGASRKIEFSVSSGNSVEDGVYYNWVPVRVETMLADGSDTWSTNWTYDANNPEATVGAFYLRDSMKVRMVYIKNQRTGFALVETAFLPGSTMAMGDLGVYSIGMIGYSSVSGEAQAGCSVLRSAILRASVKPGYSFSGWYSKGESGSFSPVSSNGTELTVPSVSASGCKYYAAFAKSSSSLLAWGDGAANKEFVWQSKVYVGAQYNVLRNVRVYSDEYPVKLTLMTASSPERCVASSALSKTVTISSQRAHLLPALRLDKYFCIRIDGKARITSVMLGSSMEAIKQ